MHMRHNPSIAHARVYTDTYNHTVWARAPSLLLLLCWLGFVEVLRFITEKVAPFKISPLVLPHKLAYYTASGYI